MNCFIYLKKTRSPRQPVLPAETLSGSSWAPIVFRGEGEREGCSFGDFVSIESGWKTRSNMLTHPTFPPSQHTENFTKFKITYKIRTTFWLAAFFLKFNLSTISVSWLTGRLVADFNFGICSLSFLSVVQTGQNICGSSLCWPHLRKDCVLHYLF